MGHGWNKQVRGQIVYSFVSCASFTAASNNNDTMINATMIMLCLAECHCSHAVTCTMIMLYLAEYRCSYALQVFNSC